MIGTFDFNNKLRGVDLKDQIKAAAQKNLTLTPEQIRAMNNRPDLYNQYQAAAADFKPAMQTRFDEVMPKLQAKEDAISRARAAREYAMRHPRPRPGGGFSLDNLWQAVNPFKPITNIASGKGSMQDYLSLAQMFI
jgi:hypothetical protein